MTSSGIPADQDGTDAGTVGWILLSVGFFTQLGQVLTFREVMAVSHGSELYIGFFFAAWLLWNAGGAAAGTVLHRHPALAGRGLVWSTLGCGPVLAAQILLPRLPLWAPDLTAGQALPPGPAAVMVLCAAMPLAFIGGLQFSLALGSLPQRTSRLYRLECIGAMLGGLATGFVLAPFDRPIGLALVAGMFLAVWAYAVSRRCFNLGPVFLLLALVPLASLPAGPDAWSEQTRWHRLLPGHDPPVIQNTRYGRLTVLTDPDSGQKIVFHNAGLSGVMEGAADETAGRGLADLICCQHPAPSRGLLIGGALSGLPDRILEHLDRLDLVELDPAVLNPAGRTTTGPGLYPHAMDGRTLVKKSSPKTWDLVVAVPPEPDNIAANRYCTAEFFREARTILRPGGVFGLLLPSYGGSAEYTGPLLAQRTASILRALDQVFDRTRAVPAAGHLLLAAKAPSLLTFDPKDLARRLNRRPRARPWTTVTTREGAGRSYLSPDMTPLYFESLFGGILEKKNDFFQGTPGRPALEKFDALIRAAPAELNRDGRPAAMVYSLELSNRLASDSSVQESPAGHGSPAGYIELVGRERIVMFFAFLLLLTVTAAGIGPMRLRKRYGLTLAAFAAGAGGMSGLMTLLFMYQNFCGYVYAEVGLMTALFMAGLASGAYGADRVGKPAVPVLAGALWVLAVLALLDPVILEPIGRSGAIWWTRAAVGGSIIVTGLAAGTVFPLTVRLSLGRAGAWMYAADLAGSAMAAVLTTAVLIPALGPAQTMLAAALLAATAVIGLWPLRK